MNNIPINFLRNNFIEWIKRHDIHYYFLAALSFYPIMPFGFLTFLTIITLVSLFIKCERKSFKNRLINFIKYTSFYILLIISLIYSNSFFYGINIITRSSPLLLFPLAFIFFSKKLDDKQIGNILSCFLTGSIILCVILLIGTVKELNIVGYDKLFVWATLRRTMSANEFLELHPTYCSLNLGISIFIIFKKKINIIVKFFGVLFLAVMIYLMAARGVIVSLFIAILFYFMLFLKVSIFRRLLISFFVITLGLLSFKHLHLLNSRIDDFNQIIFQETEIPIIDEISSSNEIRIVILSSIKKIISENFFLGVGVGDLQNELNEGYRYLGSPYLANEKFNTHNYYLFLFCSSGIITLLCFIYLLGWLLIGFIKTNNDFGFLFLLVFSASLLFENILSRSHGITIYCLFTTLFYLSKKNETSIYNYSSS